MPYWKPKDVFFDTQWDELLESALRPEVENLFRERGIKINRKARNIEIKGDNGWNVVEFHAFLEGDKHKLVIEAKITVTQEDVDYFLEKLSHIREYWPYLENYTVYGAIVGKTYDEGIDRYAYKNGLFVLKSDGSMIKIANDEGFKPKTW